MTPRLIEWRPVAVVHHGRCRSGHEEVTVLVRIRSDDRLFGQDSADATARLRRIHAVSCAVPEIAAMAQTRVAPLSCSRTFRTLEPARREKLAAVID